MFRTVKKIVSKQESLEVLSGVNSEFDVEQDTSCEMDVNDDENQEMSMKTFEKCYKLRSHYDALKCTLLQKINDQDVKKTENL